MTLVLYMISSLHVAPLVQHNLFYYTLYIKYCGDDSLMEEFSRVRVPHTHILDFIVVVRSSQLSLT
jgi:hypothetical protein